MLAARVRPALPLLVIFTLLAAATAQQPAKSAAAQSRQPVPAACPAPPKILASTKANIFSDQQEQWLGEATADQIEHYYRVVDDPAQNAYLDHIVQRLLAVLPPTGIQFHAAVIDSSAVNAFSIAGGRIYIMRKLIATAHNEDEVAGVVAHEMGHILTHQFAYRTTADLNRLLNVTSLGDRADVYAKFQQLIDARLRDKHPSRDGNSDEGQDEADTIAVYATAAAGYRPQAYSEFWDRVTFDEGKVGGPLSDFFGISRPEARRMRAILKLVSAIPAGCGATQPTTSPEFERWQSLVVTNQRTAVASDLHPLSTIALEPPLRMELERLRFSPDGRYALAQDETSVTVLSRSPFRQLFRFNAEDALPAEFTPDSQHIVFHTPGLHTEEWSIADQKLFATHDPIVRHSCIESRISPDGRTIFCISFATEMGEVLVTDLNVLDAASGNVLYQKKSFFTPSFGFYLEWLAARTLGERTQFIPSSVSPDGNLMLIGPSEEKLAFDLRSRTPVPIGKGLRNNVTGAYAFVGNDKVLGVSRINLKDSGLFNFPEGSRAQPAPFGLTDLESVTSGNYVLSRNIDNYAIGLADVYAAKFVLASRARSMDVYDGWLLNENVDGSVVLHKIGDKTTFDQTASLPLSPLGPSLVAALSPDRRYIALSTRTRGGVWDLQTGSRILQSHRFNSAWFAPDNSLFVDFPKLGKDRRAIVHFDLSPVNATPLDYKVEGHTALAHGALLEWRAAEHQKTVTLVVHDVRDNSVLWQRTFPEGEPAHVGNIVSGQTVLAFRLKSDTAKQRIAASEDLAAQAAKVKNRDATGLIQLIDNRTGNILRELVLEAPLDYEGLIGVHFLGDTLYVTGNANRTIAYSLPALTQSYQFFGHILTADPQTRRICALNRSDEATVYDDHGNQLADFRARSPLRLAVFESNGTRLILLTSDQKVLTLDVPSTPPATTTAGQ